MHVPGWLKEWTEVTKVWWPIFAAAIAVAGPLVWRYVIQPAARFLRRLDQSMVKVDTMSKALGDNGGSTLADMIRLTAKASTMNGARIAAFIDHLERPLFEADTAGEFSRVNRSLEILVGYSNEELRGRGWISVVVDQERDRTVREWFHAIDDRRASSIITHVNTRHAGTLQVRISTQPMENLATGDVVAWMGAVDVIPEGTP